MIPGMRPWLAAALLAIGCAQGGGIDAGPGDSGTVDGGPMRRDAGRDAGVVVTDSGPRDASADAGPPMMDSGRPDSGPPGTDGGRDAGPGVCAPAAATIEISEIMVASQTGSGDRGEWFEIHNLSGCPIDLTGLEIDAGVTHTMTSGLLTAGGFFVLAQSVVPAENHMLVPGYAYGTTVTFANSAGVLVLRSSGMEIARVTWGSTDHRTGASRQLSRGATMATGLGSSSWCDSTDVYSTATGGPYLGTPGMLNRPCP